MQDPCCTHSEMTAFKTPEQAACSGICGAIWYWSCRTASNRRCIFVCVCFQAMQALQLVLAVYLIIALIKQDKWSDNSDSMMKPCAVPTLYMQGCSPPIETPPQSSPTICSQRRSQNCEAWLGRCRAHLKDKSRNALICKMFNHHTSLWLTLSTRLDRLLKQHVSISVLFHYSQNPCNIV